MNKKKNNGITLIALVITIIVMLILVTTTIKIAVNGGLFDYARRATQATQNAINEEQDLQNIVDDYMSTNGEKIEVSYTKTGGTNIPSSTVTLNIKLDRKPFTLEKKKEIATTLCEFSTYNELCDNYGINEENLKALQITEEQAIDKIIEIGRRFIDYKDTSKLRELGVEIISVKTPYGNTLYTSTLGEPIKCSFNKNGTYDFIIKKGTAQKKQKVVIDNIMPNSTTGKHKVTLEGGGYLYSTDGKNDWKELGDTTTIECNNEIYLKFAGEKPEGNNGEGLHYVEKNEEYYKYFNDEQMGEWGMIRSFYIMDILARANAFNRQNIIRIMAKDDFNLADSEEKIFAKIFSFLYTARTINFAKDFPNGFSYKTGGKNEKFTDEMSKKYPELELGNDNVITWYSSSQSDESPIYKLNVDHDMNISLFTEVWD